MDGNWQAHPDTSSCCDGKHCASFGVAGQLYCAIHSTATADLATSRFGDLICSPLRCTAGMLKDLGYTESQVFKF